MPAPSRRAGAVLLTAVLLTAAGGFGVAGADDPPPPTTATPPTSVTGPTDPPSSVSGGVTTTTDPDAPTTTTPSSGGFGPPTTEPGAPPEPPMPDPSPQVRILLEQLLSQNHQRIVLRQAKVAKQSTIDVDRYERRERTARADLKRVREATSANDRRLAAVERNLRADALTRYMDPGATPIERLMDSGDDRAKTRGVLVEVTTGIHLQQRRDALARRATLRRRVAAATARVRRTTDEATRARTRAKQAEDRVKLEAAQLAAEQRLVSAANAKIDADYAAARADVIGDGSANWSLPIAGKSVFTAPELAEWFTQRGVRSRAQAPVDDLTRYYIDEGDDQGIRGDMAFAQSVLETGSFTNPDTIRLNNFAGIGHCDTCASGFSFATPQLGVRAQIQLLADYTQRGVELAHPLVDRRLHGPSGCCQTWWQLTHTWATAGNYGPKIMGIYREMLYWLVVHRGMTPLVGPR